MSGFFMLKSIKKREFLKWFGNGLATRHKKNRKELIFKSLQFNLVLRAGLEPARTLLFTGF